MDKYIRLKPGHPVTFPLFLGKNLSGKIHPKKSFTIPSQEKDYKRTCHAYERLLHYPPADLCAMGAEENGHVAFNDPPYADFFDLNWVKTVKKLMSSPTLAGV